jgi:hypothetical protein
MELRSSYAFSPPLLACGKPLALCCQATLLVLCPFFKDNITANCIGAGGTESGEAEGGLSFPPGTQDSINRCGKPEEMAFLAVSLASDNMGYVSRQCMMANGGKYFLYNYDDPYPHPEPMRERSLQPHRPSLRSAGCIALLGC